MAPNPFKNGLSSIRQMLGLKRLAARERRLLFIAMGFIVVLVAFQFVIAPFFNMRRNLEQSIARKQQERAQIRAMQNDYRSLRKEEGSVRAKINGREAGFTLFTFLDKQAETAKVKKQIKYMKPSTLDRENELRETMVEMKLQQIGIADLVAFLLLIESEKNAVFIRRFSLQESGNEPGFLDVIIQVVTFEKKG